MAGDWIKMRVGLVSHPRVLRIAECLLEDGDFLEWSGLSYGMSGCPAPTEAEHRAERHAALRVTRYVTVTALLRFWGYANEHAKGDQIDGIWPEDIEEIVGVPGFSSAIEAAGWVRFDAKDGGLQMPNFEEHNTSATLRSATGADRQKRYRERKKSVTNSDVTRDVTRYDREEKRREERNTPLTPKGESELPGFSAFWQAWPSNDRKQAKGKCRDAWKKAGAEPQAALVLSHVNRMKASPLWTKDLGQFVPAPLVYLNQRRWEGAEAEERPALEAFV